MNSEFPNNIKESSFIIKEHTEKINSFLQNFNCQEYFKNNFTRIINCCIDNFDINYVFITLFY